MLSAVKLFLVIIDITVRKAIRIACMCVFQRDGARSIQHFIIRALDEAGRSQTDFTLFTKIINS